MCKSPCLFIIIMQLVSQDDGRTGIFIHTRKKLEIEKNGNHREIKN